MKRKRLTGWKRMAAFAMALTLTVGDWTSVGAAGLPQTDVQTVTEAVIQEEDAMEAALATEQTEKESETDSESAENDSGQTVEEVRRHIQQNFALAIEDDGFIEAEPPEPIFTLDGKNIFTKKDIGIEHVYHCDKYGVAKAMTAEEVCEDIKTFITRVRDFFEAEGG